MNWSEDTFKDYIKTTVNPSTRTIDHKKCGLTFNFIDEKSLKKYSSKKELKILAGKFAENNLPPECTAQFLLEVDRLKSRGRPQDSEIMVRAYRKILELYLKIYFGRNLNLDLSFNLKQD